VRVLAIGSLAESTYEFLLGRLEVLPLASTVFDHHDKTGRSMHDPDGGRRLVPVLTALDGTDIGVLRSSSRSRTRLWWRRCRTAIVAVEVCRRTVLVRLGDALDPVDSGQYLVILPITSEPVCAPTGCTAMPSVSGHGTGSSCGAARSVALQLVLAVGCLDEQSGPGCNHTIENVGAWQRHRPQLVAGCSREGADVEPIDHDHQVAVGAGDG
jgi:hypothetical protein